MKKILLSLTILLALAIQVQSQNLAKKEKIKSLFALMHQDSLMIKTIDAMTVSMVKNMSVMFSDTAYTNHGIDVSKMMKKLMEKSMQKSKENAMKLLNGDMVDIYDKYFTIEEIEDFSNFYKSTSGQKMLTQMPDITKDLMDIMMTKYQPDFQQSFMKDVQEIRDEMTEQIEAKQN
ncbi:MAG: DUF2059 domain-containing protein [Ferruginibacter sp.]